MNGGGGLVVGEAKRRQQQDPTWGQPLFVRQLKKPRIPEDQYLAAIGCLPDLIYERRYGLQMGELIYTPTTYLEDLFRVRHGQLATALAWELLGRSNNLVSIEFSDYEGVQHLVKLNVGFWQLAKAVIGRWGDFEDFWPIFEHLPTPWDWMLACCCELLENSMKAQGLLDKPRIIGKGKLYGIARQAKQLQKLPLESFGPFLIEDGDLQDVEVISPYTALLEHMGQSVASVDADCGKRFKPWFTYLNQRTSAYRDLERSDVEILYCHSDGLKNSKGETVNC